MDASGSISLRPHSLQERIVDGYRRFMRAVASRMEGPPRLPNYDRACSDLGGVPWRRFEATEQWFIPTPTTNLDADFTTPSVESAEPDAVVNLKPPLPVHVIVGAGSIVAVLLLLAFVFTRTPSHHDVASAVSTPAPVAAAAPVAQPSMASDPVAKHVKAKKPRERAAKRHAPTHHRASAQAHGRSIA